MRLKLKQLPLLLSFVLLCALPLHAQTRAPAKSHRVIWVVTSPDPADWTMTLNNVSALVTGVASEPVEIEVLAYGPGIDMLKKTGTVAAGIRGMESPHIRFVACQHAMRMHNIQPSGLVPGVTSVPSGVVELVRRQEQGWAYIKAGR